MRSRNPERALGKRRGVSAAGGVIALALVVVLCGCGSSEPAEAGPAKPASTPLVRPPNAAAADMVAAVSARPGAGLVELRFSLTKRPKVGEPVDIELALTPAVELESLFARFQAADGLQLVSGAETDHLEHPAANVAVGHRLTVVPKSDGIFYVTAIVLADSDKESIARTFSIPIIAGQGLEELPATASVADSQRAPARP